jgi:prepilin-type processing-associated H-X9-DG protein
LVAAGDEGATLGVVTGGGVVTAGGGVMRGGMTRFGPLGGTGGDAASVSRGANVGVGKAVCNIAFADGHVQPVTPKFGLNQVNSRPDI